jgi:prolyl 4-hydroxylase
MSDVQAEVARRAQAGDADALYTQAVWAMTGEHGPEDLERSRALFRQAGEAGRFDAAIIYVNFVVNGTGGPADWQGALTLLRKLAIHDPALERQIELIERMQIAENGSPVSVPDGRLLSEEPHVTLISDLLTAEECDYLMSLARPMLQPAMVEEAAGQVYRHPGRTSDSVGLTWPVENPVVFALNKRIAAASRTDVMQGEPVQILRYRPGQEYKPHFDAIPGFTNQRTLTCIVWLNVEYEGGETLFLKTSLKAKGGKGDALLFRNADADGQRDESSAHAGLPVTRGEKWLASRWIRAHPLR